MDGITFATEQNTKELEYALPGDCSGKKIVLRLTGGVGDILISLGGTAAAIKEKWPTAHVTAACRKHQLELLDRIVGLDKVIDSVSLNKPGVRNQFDVLLDFSGTFANNRQIRNDDYYRLVSKQVGLEVRPPKLYFSWKPAKVVGREVVAIHAGGSNPNRHWYLSKWQTLSERLMANGYYLKFLGTWDEFSLEGEFCENLSETSERLVDQVYELSNCHYFIGNDSGFAHIAGILGIPGLVLFFSTVPENVIGQYPSLKAVHCFDGTEIYPTNSLQVNCPIAFKATNKLTVDDVLKQFPGGAIACTTVEANHGRKQKLAVVTVNSHGRKIAEYLSEFYDVDILSERSEATEYYGVLEVTIDNCVLQVGSKRVVVDMYNFENIRRAIREVAASRTLETV